MTDPRAPARPVADTSLTGCSALFERVFEMEFGHCDAAGVVYHPRYLDFFDWNTVLMLQQALGRPERDWAAAFGYGAIPVVALGCQYRRPLTWGDRPVLRSGVARIGRSSFDLVHVAEIDGEVAVENSQTRVWCGRDAAGGFSPAEIPGPVRAALGGSGAMPGPG